MKIITLAIAALALGLSACSMASLQTFGRNISAADCATPASQQAFVGNLPQIAFMTNAQALAAMAQFCVGAFGTVSAPASAPGMSPAFPAPTAVPTPAPAAKTS